MDNIACRKYQPGDEPAILELNRAAFGHGITREYWEWKYLKNPAGRVYVYLAFDGDRCIGQYAMLPMRLCDHGRDTEALVALDNMVHPHYQRRGILQRLEKMAAAERPTNIPYYTFLNENSFAVYTKKFGWHYPGPLDVFLCPVNVVGLAKRNPLWHAAKPFVWGYCKIHAVRHNPARLILFEEFDAETETLWEQNKAKVGITLNRCRDFLRWRYSPNSANYLKFQIRVAGQLKGYTVMRIREMFGLRIGWVMDIFLSQDDEPELCRYALLAVQDRVRDQCDFVSLIPPCAKYRQAIKRAGFKKVPAALLPHRFFFCVRQNDYPNPAVLDREKWYFSWSLHDTL